MDSLSFTEQLKHKFIEIRHFTYDNNVWFQGSAVASSLEYENTRQAILEHVHEFDNLRGSELLDPSILTVYAQGNPEYQSVMLRGLHPETLFINNLWNF